MSPPFGLIYWVSAIKKNLQHFVPQKTECILIFNILTNKVPSYTKKLSITNEQNYLALQQEMLSANKILAEAQSDSTNFCARVIMGLLFPCTGSIFYTEKYKLVYAYLSKFMPPNPKGSRELSSDGGTVLCSEN